MITTLSKYYYAMESQAVGITIQGLSIYDMTERKVNFSESRRGKTYILVCASNEDSNQPAHPSNLISIFVVCIKKLHPWLSKMRPRKILITQADLILRWAHMSIGTFSDVTSYTYSDK